MKRNMWVAVTAATLAWWASGTAIADDAAGKAIYDSGCIGCHGTGVLGAPKLGDKAAWAPRVAGGLQAVVNSARAGKGSMPPKGGNMALTDAQLLSVVSYMVGQSGGVPATAAAKPAAVPPTKVAAAAAPAPAAPAKPAAAAAAPAAAPAPARGADDAAGKAIYDNGCAGCHGTGVLGSPKVGDAAAWGPRAAGGIPGLVNSARAGKGAMPPKGGNAALTDAQLTSVVTYMVAQSGGASAAAGKSAAAAQAPAAPPAPVAVARTPAPAAAAPAPAVSTPTAGAPATSPATTVAAAPNVNSFNRLLRPTQRNLPPAEDKIHDPGNDGTLALQAPLTAFNELPRSNAGNRVDWVKSLSQGKIAPRADRIDAKAVPAVMDLNVVREVKGSMPDVVYPHKQHTEWLDCSNCHPAIFKPQKGANQISMAAILLGEACGVCHGKVAFPVSECRLCHSKTKPLATAVAVPAAPAK